VLHEARQADDCGTGITLCCGSGGRRPLALVTPLLSGLLPEGPRPLRPGSKAYLLGGDFDDQPSSFLAIGLDVKAPAR
jgi:hypothetical protein